MREVTFRGSMVGRIGERTIDSYVAYCRRVERELSLDLDDHELTNSYLAETKQKLSVAGVSGRSLGNCMSALRAYATMSRQQDPIRLVTHPATSRPRMAITREQRQAWVAHTSSGPFNHWLDMYVRNSDGQLDLERLHALALQYGVDRREAYSQLNPGQQRMNLGNLLRARVPPAVYQSESPPPTSPSTTVPAPAPEPTPKTLPPSEQTHAGSGLAESSTGALLAHYGEILDELRRREVVRTGNSPVGDYAEHLFAKAFAWTLEPNSAAGHDATDSQGVRYQIKGRRLATATGSRQLSAIRRLNDNTFDMLAAVLFDASFRVTRAILIPHEVVVLRARRSDHTNGWTFILDDKVWRAPGVSDVTAQVAVAASRF